MVNVEFQKNVTMRLCIFANFNSTVRLFWARTRPQVDKHPPAEAVTTLIKKKKCVNTEAASQLL